MTRENPFAETDIYRWIAEDNAEFEIVVDGTSTTHADEQHLALLIALEEIECFVKEVLATDTPGFSWILNPRSGRRQLVETPLSRYFKAVIPLFQQYSPSYRYSPHVSLFFECCFALDLGKEWFLDPKRGSSRLKTPGEPLLQHELFEQLIDLLRVKAQAPESKAQVRMQQEKVFRRFKSARRYVEKIFRKHSKVLVLRIDFSYRHEDAKGVTPKMAKRDLLHFLHNRRGKPNLFKDCLGYIWKLEHGPEKGYHFHLIFFYNGSTVMNDAYWAHGIGNYWKSKTCKGRGLFYNCNAVKKKYRRLGIGMITRYDEAKRQILVEDVLGYLVKNDQYLKAVELENIRCFGTGIVKPKNNCGRPPNDEAYR